MADFAPYQDTAPETVRALSPPPASPTRSPSPRQYNHHAGNIGAALNSPSATTRESYFPSRDMEAGRGATGFGGSVWGTREEINMFETRLGIRMDFEACLSYLLLPPAGAVLLLVLEHKSDYVRFHAWQASLLFTFMFIIHVIFSWSPVLSWLLFAFDIGMIAWLTLRAYRDAETLDRCEVPFFGPLASSILDDE